MRPDDVDDIFGEPWVFFGSQPPCHSFPTGEALKLCWFIRSQESGDCVGLGHRVSNLSAAVVDDLLVRILSRLFANLSKQGGKAEIIVHCPAIKWVVMTLRALDAGTHENLGHILRAFHYIIFQFEVVRGRVFEGAASGRQQVKYDLVKGFVIRDLIAEPFVPEQGRLIANLVRIVSSGANLKQFGPLHDPHFGEFLPFKKLADEGLTFARARAFNKLVSFLLGWEDSCDVEEDPSHEYFITTWFRGVDSQLVQLGVDMSVDVVGFLKRGFLVFEVLRNNNRLCSFGKGVEACQKECFATILSSSPARGFHDADTIVI